MIEIITAIDWNQAWAVIATVGALFGAIGTAVERAKKKDVQGTLEATEEARAKMAEAFGTLRDFFNPFIPQTEEQTEVALEQLSSAAYIMDMADYERMCKELRESGAQFNERGLWEIVCKMENEAVAEYAIMVEDHDGNPNTECKHAFVSYGTPVVMSQAEVFKRAVERHAQLTAVSN